MNGAVLDPRTIRGGTHPFHSSHARGIYTLANDGVYHWLAALLASCREHEPDLPVIVIPFDDRLQKVSTLRERYQFEVMEDQRLAALDQVGKSYFPDNYNWAHVFRKFAAFWGPFERFVFLDSDVVLLGPLGEFFDRAEESDAQFITGDLDLDQVYPPGPLRDSMVATGATVGFNTGFFMSTRETMTLEQVEHLGQEGLAIRKGFLAATAEQPFMNWCVSVSGLKVRTYYDLVPDMCFSTWAKRGPYARVGGTWRLRDSEWADVGRRMPLLHWAGYGLDFKMPNMRIFLHYRLAHTTRRDRLDLVSSWTANSITRISRAVKRRFRR